VAPTIITYILAVAPFQAAADEHALTSLHSLLIDEEAGPDRSAGGGTTRHELLAFGCGVLLVVLLSAQTVLVGFTWLELILLIESGLEFGLLGVVIYGSLASTRVTNTLLRRPMRIDPLEVTPFEAIGRQSLSLALVFVGGITLSLLFVGAHPEAFLQWQLYVVYAPLILMPMLVFFLSMAPTHRRLQAARDGELRRVQGLIRRECAELVRRMEAGEEPAACAQRVTALTAYEARLLEARTWPYNTTMLRTVFVSVLIPGATMVGRVLADLLGR